MAWTTPKVDWSIANGVSTDDLNRIEGNLAHLVNYSGLYGVTTGSNTAYITTIPGLIAMTEGVKVTLKLHSANGANATLNINGLGAYVLRKANGNAVPAANLKLNSIYTFVFSGSAFILQGEGGGGTARPEHVLAPQTFTNEDGEQIGTIPTITSGQDPALGVGQWPDGGLAVYPSRGYRKGGAGEGEIKVTPAQLQSAEPSLRGPYILSGHNIYGTEGSMPNRSAQNDHMPSNNSTVWAGDRIFLQPPDGWYNGSSWVTAPAPALVPNNLREGTNILGVGGTMVERGRTSTSNGFQNMPSHVDADWNINIGYRPMIVFYQWWIYYGVENVYNEYGMNRYWGMGFFSKSLSGSTYKHVAANGFTSGSSNSFGSNFWEQWNPESDQMWQSGINWESKENLGAPGSGNTGFGGGITDSGFRLGMGSYFRDNRGQNAAQLNWFCE